jgi:hypothetical protein
MSDDFGNIDDTMMRADLDSVFTDDDDLDIFSTDGGSLLDGDEEEDEDGDEF